MTAWRGAYEMIGAPGLVQSQNERSSAREEGMSRPYSREVHKGDSDNLNHLPNLPIARLANWYPGRFV